MTLEKLEKQLHLIEENARANNREGAIDELQKCYEIIKEIKPHVARYKTELEALSSIAESIKIISEKR